MSQPLKILQVVPALHQGGVETGTVEMSDYLIKQGWQSVVASHGGKMVKTLLSGGGKHIQLPLHHRNPLHILYNAMRLAMVIKKERPDIVHARSRAPAWSAYFACKWTKTPFLTSFHGTHGTQNRFKMFYNRIMLKGVHVIANSNFIQQHLIEVYGEKRSRITIAQRGFNPQRFNLKEANGEGIRQQYGIAKNTAIILMVGRFTRWKGQHILLQALQHLKLKDYVVLLVGSSNKRSEYTQELENLASDKVIFCGSQSNLADYYKAAGITISASTRPEAFGRVAVESQAMGTPVIATSHGGSLETIQDGETGWLIPPNDAKALAEKIDIAFKNRSTLATMGKKAYNWATTNFTTDKMCEREFAVYKKILRKK